MILFACYVPYIIDNGDACVLSDPNPANSLLSDGQASRLLARLDRLAPVLLGLVIAYSLVKSIVESASTALWGDEVFTLILARQPQASVVWRALSRGADGQPPLFYLIEHAFLGLAGNPHIALRLPSILAFCCTLVLVYAFMRKRTSEGPALVCAIFLLHSSLYSTYVLDARPYSMVVAAFAAAMVCYQRASKFRWTVLLFLSLTLAVCLHYYAVFAPGAFAVAEAFYFLRERKLRAGVWLAILCSGLPLIAFWPLLRVQRSVLGEHFWARPKLSVLLATYGDFFQLPVSLGIGFAAILALSLIIVEPETQIPEENSGASKGGRSHENVLLLALLGMPFAVFAVSRLAHGAYLDRYVLWVTLAMTMALGCSFLHMRRRSQVALMICLLAAVGVREAYSLYSLKGRVGKIDSPAASVEKLVRTAGNPELPVVVWADYFEISYYAAPELAKRLVTVTDPKSALAYMGTDSVDKLYNVLADYSPAKVCEFNSFAATHPAFLLYSTSFSDTQGSTLFYDWWVPRLVKDGYSLSTVAAEGNRRVYLVRAPSP